MQPAEVTQHYFYIEADINAVSEKYNQIKHQLLSQC